MPNEESPASLKRQRATIKAACTRIRTYVESVVNINSAVIAQLEERKAKLDHYWSEYNLIQTRLEAREDAEANDRAAFEEAFYALSAGIRELLNSTLPARGATGSSTPASSHHELADTLTHVRLPKLSLPTFSGKYDEWFPFFDTFHSVIHSNVSLNNIQKFQYLRASITGDASSIINSLEISDANYEVAWTLLKQRYDNKRVIVQNHIKAIMELPSMTKENCLELRQIADGAAKHLHALQALKRPVAQWDDLLVHVLSSKLDAFTLREWQSSLAGTDLPNLKQFFNFITHRCQTLEATSKPNVVITRNVSTRSVVRRQSSCVATVTTKCSYCQGEHSIYYCNKFLALPVSQRIAEIRNRKVCVNCLRSSSHTSSKCTSGHCKVCRAKHNTLLHAATTSSESSDRRINNGEALRPSTPPALLVTNASGFVNGNCTMLSTALIHAYDNQGSRKSCRVLLDCGSQANFISRKFLAILGLKPRSLNVSISGINGIATTSSQAVQIRLQSRLSSYIAAIECIVADHLTDKLPAFTIKRNNFEFPRNIKLADPRFNVSSEVDLLIGADLFWELLCVGQVKSSHKHPTLQKTKFGWVLAGRLGDSSHSPSRVHSFHASVTNALLHEQLRRFWQLEDTGEKTSDYTIEENTCEQHFLNNVSQNSQGRYVVKLPIKEQAITRLGDSRSIALRRLKSLEGRFKRDPELKIRYMQFIDEYLSLGHMRPINPRSDEDLASFYLPHHCVFKVVGQSSKLRVVFDASCKSSSGLSLNDALMVGPVVQQDLTSILIRFRTFRYVFTADVIKMYRQILVHPSQVRLQRILWRSDPALDVDTYELTTVTYGTSSASYLATRCLTHLAEQFSSEYPIGSMHVKRDFYMDDLLTGADTISEALLIRDEITKLLHLGSFDLSKWASNSPQLLNSVINRDGELIAINDELDSRILGIQWNQAKDTFQFSCEHDPSCQVVSKRVILSEIAKLFDPLGLLGPTVVIAKLILQELWLSGVHWDESVSQDIHNRWSNLKSQLNILDKLRVSRCVKFRTSPRDVQIHGFCDASQRAYGACVYIRTRLGPDEYRLELLCSKSRVAPLKAISLPRLELSAALLLARLIAKIRESIDVTNIQVFLWSDSTIALNWLASSSRRWSTFVANRVGEIQRLTEIENWRHVASSNNPADVLSRGLLPLELANASMWWHGPDFLQLDDRQWPSSNFVHLGNDIPDRAKIVATITTLERCIVNELLSRCSSLNKICRIVAYCFRFFKSRRPSEPTAFISPAEISYSLNILCKAVQGQAFPSEYRALSKGDAISNSSNLLSLTPFLDETGLIRVGGRLKNSGLQVDARHPILLPRNHDLTRRVIEYEHIRNLHAGTQATMAAVRQRFWPLSLRSTARKIIQKCVTCFKAKPRLSETIMSSLPAGRVTVSRPFSHCGVDYAGPVVLREGRRRNARNHKAYISIFVCFATKGVHIELVSDLTSDAFLGAFKRFISRRGKPSHMYSDNGTTFVGAQGQLNELYNFVVSQQAQSEVKQFLRDQEIVWNFIPPNAPHFGGLWEAAVKSAKYHMARIVGKAHLTYEEMQTTLCEIEAILNSRPITSLSADPNDLAYLSPGHFLIGTTLNSFPCRDLSDVNENRLVRWQRVELIRQHFWRRWSTEYLHSLQERHKWKHNKGVQLQPNQLVLIKQQNLAPLQWTLGRVQDVHPGSDDTVRTATVKTTKGLFVRPLSKLAILPIDVVDDNKRASP